MNKLSQSLLFRGNSSDRIYKFHLGNALKKMIFAQIFLNLEIFENNVKYGK